MEGEFSSHTRKLKWKVLIDTRKLVALASFAPDTIVLASMWRAGMFFEVIGFSRFLLNFSWFDAYSK